MWLQLLNRTAEIFVSRARPMVPSLFRFWQIRGPLPRWLTSGEAEVFGGVLYRANPFLRPTYRMLRFVIRKSTGHNY
jgi:hypothetical protein